MRPCQGLDGGSIPLICSKRKYARTFRAFLLQLTQIGLVFLCIGPHVSSLEVIQRLSYKERMVFMVNIIKQEVVIEESLKKKLEQICEFSNTTLKIINGSIRKIDRTNLTYVEPHRIIINDITFLVFNYSNEIFKALIYLIKKKLKAQPRILITKWMNMLKIFMKIKKAKKRTMALSYKLSSLTITML